MDARGCGTGTREVVSGMPSNFAGLGEEGGSGCVNG